MSCEGSPLGQWKFEEHETLVKLSLYDNEHVLPKFRVTIHVSLKFCIKIRLDLEPYCKPSTRVTIFHGRRAAVSPNNVDRTRRYLLASQG